MSIHRTMCITLVIGRFIFYSLYYTASDGNLGKGLGTRLGGMGTLAFFLRAMQSFLASSVVGSRSCL